MKTLKQLCFSFVDVIKGRPVAPVRSIDPPAITSARKRDHALEKQACHRLIELGLTDGAKNLRVEWNSRMRSTAGYARWPQWRVDLNPRLTEFDGEVERTLLHELAHLIAYARANRRRIQPHGAEWRRACADLGIPDESARHTLPLPRSKQTRKFSYSCPSCGHSVERVRKFKRHSACLTCCKKHNQGRFDARFQFVLKKQPQFSKSSSME
ncbi:MAG: SprT family zinc-dependent metalloprotease [Verrucomicrobiaceae bacterium]